MTLVHEVNATLKVTTVSINNESILDIMTVVLWLPDSVERYPVKLINLTSLTWSHLIATICGYPLNNGMTVWVSQTRRSRDLRTRVANKLCAAERNVTYELCSKLIVWYVLASTWNVVLSEGES